ncbi:SigE family RNA polymerase sigma factor [Actinomadura kijaniata]|uniref:SigE family RNA polymerase sigma factor n=1 Tax=Actinomadura kijaniata TaxID=46161 RepID=UPI003F1C5D5A
MHHSPNNEFSRYVTAIRSHLRHRAFLLCRDWHEADDLVQRTLIKIFLRWETLDRRDELSAYARTVMVRTFINHRATPGRSREFLTDQLPEPEPRPGGQEQVVDRILLLDKLAELGPRQRAVIVLRYWENLTVKETAEALSCSPATVRSQTFRALTNLRALLRHDLGPREGNGQDPM